MTRAAKDTCLSMNAVPSLPVHWQGSLEQQMQLSDRMFNVSHDCHCSTQNNTVAYLQTSANTGGSLGAIKSAAMLLPCFVCYTGNPMTYWTLCPTQQCKQALPLVIMRRVSLQRVMMPRHVLLFSQVNAFVHQLYQCKERQKCVTRLMAEPFCWMMFVTGT